MQNDIPKILEFWTASSEKSVGNIINIYLKTRFLEMNKEVLLFLIRE